MRKYKGKYPTHIRSISSIGQGVALIETNEGGKYFLHARDTNGILPKLGDDIYAWRFRRAQPVVFQQDVTAFHRMDEGYAIPFVEYPSNTINYPSQRGSLEGLERQVRKQFIHDMARQDILARFKEDHT